MQNSTAISIKDVSKKFRLFNSPKQRLLEALHPFKKKYHHEFWALRDINFDVPKGQTLGIIGRNGSGKSTLLQIICAVLHPTTGAITTNGKISALLELGTGFNPEFSGRVNIMLYGSLMGFSPQEMQERIPLIETFADIGDFFDQPMKTYSSGMFVRLAFAAAINVDPEILIVDEALAVGDAKFQHKCFQKFLEFQNKGKTIILVTHDTHAIIKHCDYAVLLENGRMLESGQPQNVVNNYVDLLFTRNSPPIQKSQEESSQVVTGSDKIADRHELSPLDVFFEEIPRQDNCISRRSYNKNEYRHGDKRAEIIDYFVVYGQEYDPVMVYSGDTIDIYIKAVFNQSIENTLFGLSVNTLDGIVLYGTNTYMSKASVQTANKGDIFVFKYSVRLNLYPGDVFIDLGVGEVINNQTIPIERRCSIIHLHLQEKNHFAGLVDLESSTQEIFRRSAAPMPLL